MLTSEDLSERIRRAKDEMISWRMVGMEGRAQRAREMLEVLEALQAARELIPPARQALAILLEIGRNVKGAGLNAKPVFKLADRLHAAIEDAEQ